MNKLLVAIVITTVIVGGLGFYAGLQYAQANKSANRGQAGIASDQQFGGSGTGRRAGLGAGANFSGGEILSKDDKSITIKLRDGGSKIVFISNTTQVMKSTAGSLSDLVKGEQVTVTGSANADGSLTAQGVQIRPTVITN